MKQLTVLTPNKPGVLAAITSILAERGVNLDAFDIQALNKTAVISLTVDQYDVAIHALKDHGYKAITEDSLVIKLEDKPGALATVAMRLKDAGIDLRSMHILRRDSGATVVSLVSSDHVKTAEILADVIIAEGPK